MNAIHQTSIGLFCALLAADALAGSMVPIPRGQYVREGGTKVSVGDFSLFSTEITWSQYRTVWVWARQHGYEIGEGIGQADLPAQNITWHDAVKWCNALSEMTGREPVYFTDAAKKEVYRKGRAELTSGCVKWDANGFRLPTEAEWEYAYRAGTSTAFYWGNHIRSEAVNHQYAVFHEWGTDEIDGGPLPVASKKPNAFGLHDMAGNVEEWVWDRYAIGYESAGTENPKGPDAGPLRVLRGGGFVIDRLFGAADRHPTYPFFINCDIGFRVASSDPQASGDALAAIATLPPGPNDTKPFAQPEPILDRRDDTDEAAAKRLFPMLDLNAPALKEVADAYAKQDYAGALRSLCDLYAQRLKASDLEPVRVATVDMAQADQWLNVFQQNRAIRWSGPQADNRSPWDFAVSTHLARAWVKTGKAEYRDAFFWMLNDAALRAKPSWDRLTKLEKGSKGSPRDCYYAFIGFDAAHPLAPFEDLAWMLKHTPEGQSCAIPPRTLANALYSAVTDRLSAGLQDDRGNVPNQVWGNAIYLIKCGKIFAEFKDAPLWYAEGVHRVRNAAGTVMADGTDLEASLNYNMGLFGCMESLNPLFPDEASRPEWLKELNRRADYRRYMYLSVASPFGSFASVGNQSDDRERPRKTLKEWLGSGKLAGFERITSQLLHEEPLSSAQPPVPAFTSVALPYAGYYVQRSGWKNSDLFCFMRSSRDSVGHNHPDNNNLQVAAYGAWLLLDGGEPNYGRTDFMPKHQWIYIPYFGESEVGSVFNTNSLSVDGLLQGAPSERLPGTTEGWPEPRKLPFHASPRFELMEGRFDGTYYSEPPVSDQTIQNMVEDYGSGAMAEVLAYNAKVKQTPPREIHAVHQRQVFFLKQNSFWVVVDQVDGGSDYTQTWHFPPPSEGLNAKSYICPGFDPNQVRYDEAAKRIVTISHYRPNIALLNFHAAPVRYVRHFGDKFPFRGWYSFGIGGERIPAVTVEAAWSGSAPMVTVLRPSKARENNERTFEAGLDGFTPLNTESSSGFAYTDKTAKVSFQASREPRDFTAGPLTAKARVLLIREEKNGKLGGIVLDGEALTVDGKAQKTGCRDFEFAVENGVFKVVAPVTVPQGFEWKPNAHGEMVPHYESTRTGSSK